MNVLHLLSPISLAESISLQTSVGATTPLAIFTRLFPSTSNGLIIFVMISETLLTSVS